MYAGAFALKKLPSAVLSYMAPMTLFEGTFE